MRKTIFLSGLLVLLFSGINQVLGQSIIISGTIVDSITQETLPSVNIVEIDQNGRFIGGTVSDLNGNYVFRVSDVNNPIQVSFISYQKKIVYVRGRTEIDFQLNPESLGLEEVMIVGEKMGNDGVTSVRDRATAVTRIEMDGLKSVMSTTVEDMLQGRIGNVDISTISGDPGAGLNIRIRGTASLNARNQPLIVINGIPYDANIEEDFDFAGADIEQFGSLIDVSPEDIESIEVLKDAASTAMWGSRASNGVLMIRTKRGIKSKPMFEFTSKSTLGVEPPHIPMLDGAGYARLITEAHYNYDLNTFYSDEIAFDPEWEEYHNYSQNTNWVDEITKNAFIQQLDFSVRGGGEKTRYNMSVAFNDEGGTTIGTHLNKLNLRSSLDYDLSSKLQFNTDIMYTRYDQDQNYDESVRSIAYRKMPNLSIYDRDTSNIHYGEYFTPQNTLQGPASSIYNPVAFANLSSQHRYRDNARALFSGKYYFTPRLTYKATVTLDIFDSKIDRFMPYKALGYYYTDDNSNRAVNEFSKKSSVFTFNQLIYRPELGRNHEVVVLGQFDTEATQNRWYGTSTSQSASPYLTQPMNDKHLVWLGSDFSEFRSMGLYTMGSYKFKDRYSLMVGIKYEGNSKFSKEARWGFFPTLSTFWRISEETFMKNAGFIDDLKLRFSWGQSGNQPSQNYLYFNTYEAGSSVSYMDMQGVRPTGVELTSLKWETIDQINPGISFIGLQNRLNIEIDYYRKKTLNLYLEGSGIPNASGFGSLNRNEGEMENRGFELQFDYSAIRRSDFQLNMYGNISRNQNQVLSLPENYSLIYGDMLENGNYKISVVPGESLGGFFGYEYAGVYVSDADAMVRDEDGKPVYGLNKDEPLTMIMGGSSGYVFEGGDAKYVDQNYDGKIDELDLIYLGDLNPDLMGGFGLRTQYKNFTLNSFLMFKVGQEIINQTRMDTENMYNYDNQSMATNWRWRSEGDTTDIPRALYNEGYNWLGSSRFVEDGSYLRLKTLSLSYNVDERLANALKVKEMRVYFTAYNLFTWTNYSGQDPDVAPPSRPDSLPVDKSKTPPSKRFMLGVNIKF
ncbi:SusC/RagA family TonB-linked outer membrane protein [Bacteroidota bacterium]